MIVSIRFGPMFVNFGVLVSVVVFVSFGVRLSRMGGQRIGCGRRGVGGRFVLL